MVGAIEEFDAAAASAHDAAAEPEARLARAFSRLSALVAGKDVEDQLGEELKALAEVEHGPAFVDQVTTARGVLGV